MTSYPTTQHSASLNVHLLNTPKPEHLTYLRDQLDETITLTTSENIPSQTDILVGGRPDRSALSASSRLKALVIPFAGIPATTAKLMRDFPNISIHNLHHNAPMTAEMALALLMAAAKRLIPSDQIFRRGDWSPRYDDNPSIVLEGKTALILGYGAIGAHLGKILMAMGMRLLATRRHVPADAPDWIYPTEQTRQLLPQADVILICLPGTVETRGLIGAAELALLPPGALVINIGRGEVIDQTALYDALRTRQLFSAGIDVWYNYPTTQTSRTHTLPADHPFHELDNIVTLPTPNAA